jgi:hypothetical protein
VAFAARRNPYVPLISGIVGFAVSVFLYVGAELDAKRYATSPSCASVFVLSAPLDGACRVASMQIVDTYMSTGKGASRHVVLAAGDAPSINVIVSHNRRGSVVHGYLTDRDRYATVQYFGKDVVLVETRSGLFETTKLPANRAQTWVILGVIFGFVGTAGALIAVFGSAGARRSAPEGGFGA